MNGVFFGFSNIFPIFKNNAKYLCVLVTKFRIRQRNQNFFANLSALCGKKLINQKTIQFSVVLENPSGLIPSAYWFS
jgi:hypothetical protein